VPSLNERPTRGVAKHRFENHFAVNDLDAGLARLYRGKKLRPNRVLKWIGYPNAPGRALAARPGQADTQPASARHFGSSR
jgi:hypothetical protein